MWENFWFFNIFHLPFKKWSWSFLNDESRTCCTFLNEEFASALCRHASTIFHKCLLSSYTIFWSILIWLDWFDLNAQVIWPLAVLTLLLLWPFLLLAFLSAVNSGSPVSCRTISVHLFGGLPVGLVCMSCVHHWNVFLSA